MGGRPEQGWGWEQESGRSWLLGSGVLWYVLGRTLDLGVYGGWAGVQLQDPTQNKQPKLEIGYYV